MHLLVSVGPRAITTAEPLQWGYGITTEVPAVYSIAPPKRGIQKVWLCRIECKLYRERSPSCIDAGIEADLRDSRLDVANPSNGFLPHVLIEERYVCGISRGGRKGARCV
jgi:hypothetical protein